MSHRFFVNPDRIQAETISFPPDLSHQICRVLRLQQGDSVLVLDNQGSIYQAVLSRLNPENCIANIIERTKAVGEPDVEVQLMVALTQREKFELVLQKCTEIGVSSFTPVITERSLVQKQSGLDKKADRWQRILREAAEQSRRARIPELYSPVHLEEALNQSAELRLFAWENETKRTLQAALPPERPQSIALLIGPEGGFSHNEAEQAVNASWVPFSMGPRILRMETAAIVASTLVLDRLGAFEV